MKIRGSDGNVGIGTGTFTDTRNTGGLHLPNSKGISFAASTNSGSRHWRIRTDDFSDHGTLQIGVSDNNTTHPDAVDEAVMTMNRNRYVGIGTTNPHNKLHVYGDAFLNNGVDVSNYTDLSAKRIIRTDGRIQMFTDNGNNVWFIATGGNGTVAATATLTISNRYAGINTATPNSAYALHVNGKIFFSSGGLNGSDDRIKYNEQDISNPLDLISQLKPQKYEKIMEFPSGPVGKWIPSDEEWENVKNDFNYGDEFGFIAQDIKNIPELSFLVTGEETRMMDKSVQLDEYSNLTTDEQNTYTISYTHDGNTITEEEYTTLTPEAQVLYTAKYTKQIETDSPLGLNYQGLFVIAIGAIQELKAKNEVLEKQLASIITRLDALEGN